MLLYVIQGARAAPWHPAPQLGQFGPEFTSAGRFVDLPPLMMGTVHGHLDGGRVG